jgi:hypothetical protein
MDTRPACPRCSPPRGLGAPEHGFQPRLPHLSPGRGAHGPALLGKIMALSSLLGAIFTLAGLWFSYHYNLTSGATIIMVAGFAFFLSLRFDALRHRFRHSPHRGHTRTFLPIRGRSAVAPSPSSGLWRDKYRGWASRSSAFGGDQSISPRAR